MMESPVLSILVISYNQRDLLRRCLNSLLSQRLSCSFEIIVSDAKSNDGTWELINEYSAFTNGIVRGVVCDTDMMGAVNRTECCGCMKLTAYNSANGKYFVNIDADDYLYSDDIYQLQIDMLESHPECSMCMQRINSLKDGESRENGTVWPQDILLKDGVIINKEDFILRGLRGLNQGYMIRRRPNDNMSKLYGKWFDDTIITLHHIQYGSVIFVDRADYIWVQYRKSISHEQLGDEKSMIYGLLPLHHIILIPTLTRLFFIEGLKDLVHFFKVIPEFPKLDDPSRKYFSQFNGFLFKYYTIKKHSFLDNIRVKCCRWICLFIKKYNITSDNWIRCAIKLML